MTPGLSTMWTPFRGWILSCQKGVAFHAPPETWLKEAVFCSIPQPVTVCYKLKTYQDGLHCARDRRQRGFNLKSPWERVKPVFVSFAAWGVLPCTVWYTPIATSDDGQKCPSCAEVCYDRVSTNLQPFDSNRICKCTFKTHAGFSAKYSRIIRSNVGRVMCKSSASWPLFISRRVYRSYRAEKLSGMATFLRPL